MRISRVFTMALTATVATALVIERQAYNRTANCLNPTWGGCCLSVNTVTEDGVSCVNATLAATNVGGSTFGTVNQYSCLNNATSTIIPLCCKYQYYWSSTYMIEKEMVCTQPNDAQ